MQTCKNIQTCKHVYFNFFKSVARNFFCKIWGMWEQRSKDGICVLAGVLWASLYFQYGWQDLTKVIRQALEPFVNSYKFSIYSNDVKTEKVYMLQNIVHNKCFL